MDPQKFRVALALHDAVDAGDAHVVALAIDDPALDLVERDRHVDRAHADAEDVDARDHPTAVAGVRSALASSPRTCRSIQR